MYPNLLFAFFYHQDSCDGDIPLVSEIAAKSYTLINGEGVEKMSVLEIVAAATLAGVLMGLVSEAGYQARVFNSSLIRVDSKFALDIIGLRESEATIYELGLPIHLATSATFGLTYFGIIRIFDFDSDSASVITIYVFFLWLSMLFAALPTAGQGFLGRKAGRYTWIEQLALHVVFGVMFWLNLTWLG
jgi:hypothetical protein